MEKEIANKKRINRITALACFNLGVHWFAVGTIIPIMTLYLLDKGISLFQVGVVMSGYGAATVIMELPTGGLADSIGRKRVYIVSIVIQILAVVILITSNTIGLIFTSSLLQGASRALSSGTMDAYFVDELVKADKEVTLQREMAKIGFFVPLGLGLGSLLGGVLPMSIGSWEALSPLASIYAVNYLFFAAVLFMQIIATLILVKEKRDSEEVTSSGNALLDGFSKVPEVLKTSVVFGLKNPILLMLLIGGFFWGFSISGLEQFWQPQVKSILTGEAKSWIFGVLTFGYFLASSLGNLLSTPLSKLFMEQYGLVLFAGRLLMGAFYLLLALQQGIILFSVLYVTLFLFNGVQNPPEAAIMHREVPSERRSTLISFSSLFMQLGGVLGSLIIAFLADRWSISSAWIAAAVLLLLSSFVYLGIYRKKPEARKTFK